MAMQTIVENSFVGGITNYQKSGIEHSARFIKNLNIHEDPNYITQHPKTAKISGTTIVDLIKWIQYTLPFENSFYYYDQSGNIYKQDSSNVFTVDRSGATIANGAAGQGLLSFDDYLYYTTSTTIGRKGKLSGTPTYADDFLSDGVTNLDQSLDTSGNTYTLATSINEGATHRQTFVPTKDPISKIEVLVAAKGTGDWTLTVHDEKNILIGSATVTNASLTNSTDNTFTFTTPLNILIQDSYHFHITSTVADGTVTTTTASDFETVDYHEYISILVPDTKWHPMIEMDGDIIIGNGRYLARLSDQAVYEPNAIVLPAGFKVRTLTKIDEFIVVGVWRGTNIDGTEAGRLYFWDSVETTYNFFVETTAGLPNFVHNSKNRLLSGLGSSGVTYLGYSPFQQLAPIPKLARGKKIEIYPGAVCEWQGNTMIGVAGSTDDNTGLSQGIYQWGNSDDKFPESMTLAYTISTGTTQSTTVQIGAVFADGNTLRYCWRDGATYGVDTVTKTSTAFNGGVWESRIFDDGSPLKPKLAGRLIVSFEPLTTGQTVTPKYKIDRTTLFTAGDAAVLGDTKIVQHINTTFNEIEFGFTLASSSNTFIIVTSVVFEFDALGKEDIL